MCGTETVNIHLQIKVKCNTRSDGDHSLVVHIPSSTFLFAHVHTRVCVAHMRTC
jgi:hypothetical protein